MNSERRQDRRLPGIRLGQFRHRGLFIDRIVQQAQAAKRRQRIRRLEPRKIVAGPAKALIEPDDERHRSKVRFAQLECQGLGLPL
jgi:hypothetical protein